MRLLHMLLILTAAGLTGCGVSTQYAGDRAAVTETVCSTFDHPYAGLKRRMPAASQSAPDPHFGEGHRFSGEAFYRVVYETESVEHAANAATMLEYYFSRLERAGFRSGASGFTPTATTDSIEIADKTWTNKDRTLFVTGQVVLERKTGEIIITTFVTGG